MRWAAAAAAILTLSVPAQAALFDRGGGMIYDDVRNITWLSDWNYAKTSGYDADGVMDWAAANTWANNLVYGGFDDWRLPTALNADGSGPCGPGFNCTGSEMGHMFYTNGVAFGTNTANLALFTNVQASVYWSGTEFARNPSLAWTFNTFVGVQNLADKNVELYAVAVRPGDVIAAIPEPSSYVLMLTGLGAMTLVMRRRRSC